MKLKILTLLPALVMLSLVIHGLNEGMSAQQSGAPSAQSATPPDKSVPAPVKSTPPPSGNALPPGPGQATTVRICTGCHAVTVITSMRKSADDWAGIVDEMRSRGANGTDEEFDQISAYLAANFGPATHPAAGASVPNP